jgi:hypothetical protein
VPTENPDTLKKSLAVIAAIGEQALSARAACLQVGIPIATFSDCVERNGLGEQYARAREYMLDAKADDLERIGEDAANADPERVAGLRLQSDNRKWYLSKLARAKYGEHVLQEHKGNVTLTANPQDEAL